MRTGRYPTPGLYHNTEEQYGAYPDISMDLLGDQHSELYGMDAQYSPLDHSMGKQLGLNNYANPEVARYWNPAEEPLDDATMGRSRHGRSLSLTGDNNFAYHTPERRLRPSYPGSGGYQQQGYNARNPRFNAPPYGTRPAIQPQVRGPLFRSVGEGKSRNSVTERHRRYFVLSSLIRPSILGVCN